MSIAKKRKYALKPNAISNNEQAAVRNVMDRFLSRSDNAPPVQERAPFVDIHTAPVDSNISTVTPFVDSNISTPKNVDIHADAKKSPQQDRHKNLNKTGKFIRLDTELLNKIKHFCVDNGLDQQQFFELAAGAFLESVDIHKQPGVDIKIAHDDLIILFKTDKDIISLYRKYLPLNKWTARDDAAGREFNDIDRRLIEYGILQCLARKGKGRINSFKYFVEEIRVIVSLNAGDEHIEAAIDSLKRYLEKQKK